MIVIHSAGKASRIPADITIDCTTLVNPPRHMRAADGRNPVIRDYILHYHPGTIGWLAHIVEDLVARDRRSVGTAPLRVVCRCNAGKHRSVVVAEYLAERLAERRREVTVIHEEVGQCCT